jgi:RNA polymerase sigma-70 factor (family 1)
MIYSSFHLKVIAYLFCIFARNCLIIKKPHKMHSGKYTHYNEDPLKLIRDLNNGSIEAFHFLFDEFYKSLLLFSQKTLMDNHLAEDIVQDSFIKLWVRNENFSSLTAIKAFLYLTVKNSCIDHLRHAQTVELHKQSQKNIKEYNEDKGFEHKIIEAETIRLINKAINELAPQCRTIFKLGLNGLKNQEIADELTISINTVKTQKQRALTALRKNLGNDLFLFMLFNAGYFLK